MNHKTQSQRFSSPQLAWLCLSILMVLLSNIQAQASTTTEVFRQIEQLGSPQRQHRLVALQTLKHLGSTAVPILIEALHDGNIQVRKNAAFALGVMGTEATEAVPALLSALQDANLRMDVAVALGQINPTDPTLLAEAVQELRLALGHADPQVRQGAAFGLGVLKSHAAVAIPELIGALQDTDEEVQIAAAITLKKIGSVARPALIEALQDEHAQVRSKAAFALGKINQGMIPNLTTALEQTDRQVRHTLAQSLEKLTSPQQRSQMSNRPGGNRPGTDRPSGNRPQPRPGGNRPGSPGRPRPNR